MKHLTTTAKINIAAQVGIAAGIVVQIAAGVSGYPTPPPGAILAIVVAGAVAFVRWQYIGVVGLMFPAWILIGAVATSGTGDRLTDPSAVGPFLGTALQAVAVVVGLGTGAALTVDALRRRRVSV